MGFFIYSGFIYCDRECINDNQVCSLVWFGIELGDVVMYVSVLLMWVVGIFVVDVMMVYGVCLVFVGVLSGVEWVVQVV